MARQALVVQPRCFFGAAFGNARSAFAEAAALVALARTRAVAAVAPLVARLAGPVGVGVAVAHALACWHQYLKVAAFSRAISAGVNTDAARWHIGAIAWAGADAHVRLALLVARGAHAGFEHAAWAHASFGAAVIVVAAAATKETECGRGGYLVDRAFSSTRPVLEGELLALCALVCPRSSTRRARGAVRVAQDARGATPEGSLLAVTLDRVVRQNANLVDATCRDTLAV